MFAILILNVNLCKGYDVYTLVFLRYYCLILGKLVATSTSTSAQISTSISGQLWNMEKVKTLDKIYYTF